MNLIERIRATLGELGQAIVMTDRQTALEELADEKAIVVDLIDRHTSELCRLVNRKRHIELQMVNARRQTLEEAR